MNNIYGLRGRGNVEVFATAVCSEKSQLINRGGRVGDVKVERSLGCSGHGMVEFRILIKGRREKRKIRTLDLRRADSVLFMFVLESALWDKALKGREV